MGIAILVSLDHVTRTILEPSDTKPTAGLQNTEGQSQPGVQKDGEGKSSPSADPNDPESEECGTDRIVEHRGTEDHLEHKDQRPSSVGQKKILMKPYQNWPLNSSSTTGSSN